MARIRRVAVLGAGTMGAAIAAHCANAGLDVVLLDLPPDQTTAEEGAAGLTPASPDVRNRLARTGLARAGTSRPSAFFTPVTAERVRVGNLDDDLAWLREVDWIIEAVVERLDVKQHLFAQVEPYRRAETIVSSNTSGLPLHRLAEGRSAAFQQHFLGTHFFNPPRSLKLLELIPTATTAPEVVEAIRNLAEGTLGKRAVRCRDTPGFIANRIGVYATMGALRYAFAEGCSVEEVDALSGPLIGRPRTATFRLADLAGLDVMAGVARELHDALPDDGARGELLPPAELERLVAAGQLGTKTNGGFYRRVVRPDGSSTFQVVDFDTLEYRPARRPDLPLLAEVGAMSDLAARLHAILARAAAGNRQAKLVEALLLPMLGYAACCVPAIGDDLAAIDAALRWGFGHTLGPFQTWQALGVAFTAERLRQLGRPVAPWVAELLARGQHDLYRREAGSLSVYQPLRQQFRVQHADPAFLDLADLKATGKMVAGNAAASLVDLADGVLCLEFHTKANSIGAATLDLLDEALALLERRAWQALVIGNQGDYFSSGVNLTELLSLTGGGAGSPLDAFLVRLQILLQRLRFAAKPVIAAPFGQTLGLGLELCLACAGICAEGDSAMGLVEVGVGLIPAGGGCKELVRRHVSPPMTRADGDPLPPLRRVLGQLMRSTVSSSAAEARDLGYLAVQDRIVLGRDQLLAAAKGMALDRVAEGYRPPDTSRTCYAAGADALAVLEGEINQARAGGRFSAHEATVARTLTRVLSGGDQRSAEWVDEATLLALERQGIEELLATEQTQQRIAHMLRTGERLKN